MSKLLIIVVIFTVSWGGLNFFGSGWLLVPVLASLLLIAPMILGQRFYFTIVDLFFYCFIVTLVMSSILNSNDKTLNYLLAWLVGTYYCLYRVPIFIAYRFHKNTLDLIVSYGAISIALISILEQILYFSNGYILFFDLPRFDYDHANYMGLFYRSYAFSNEPSNLAYYLLLTLPFVLRSLGKISFIFVIIAILPTFSASGYALGFLALSCVALYESVKKNGFRFFVYFFSVIILIPIFLILASQVEILDKIFDKVLLNSSSGSASVRLSRLLESLAVFMNNPITGSGPGFWSSSFGVSPNNIYLLVLTEGGLFGLLFFLIFLFGLCFSDGRKLLPVTSTQIHLVLVGLGFGFFTGVSFSLIGLFFITLYNQSRRLHVNELFEYSKSTHK